MEIMKTISGRTTCPNGPSSAAVPSTCHGGNLKGDLCHICLTDEHDIVTDEVFFLAVYYPRVVEDVEIQEEINRKPVDIFGNTRLSKRKRYAFLRINWIF